MVSGVTSTGARICEGVSNRIAAGLLFLVLVLLHYGDGGRAFRDVARPVGAADCNRVQSACGASALGTDTALEATRDQAIRRSVVTVARGGFAARDRYNPRLGAAIAIVSGTHLYLKGDHLSLI